MLQRNQDQNYQSYLALEGLFGKVELERITISPGFHDTLRKWVQYAEKGRNEDVSRILPEVANWINADPEKYAKALLAWPSSLTHRAAYIDPNSRYKQGLTNDITGYLLTSVQYDFVDPEVHAKMRAFDVAYPFHTNFWIRAFYANYNANLSQLLDGYLMSGLLVQVYRHIFTAKVSAVTYQENEEDIALQIPPTTPKPPTTSTSTKNVAKLIGLSAPTARSIAYASVILHYCLCGGKKWNMETLGFNYAALYDSIVDFFESGVISQS
ncbi:hypothetical protein V5O48_014485 [Marasmius crinis-equi]|uniref:Uncharacterized protein n=1 Tax=Marasmius crinis-equi TaxID=585013 RepID=A0ABR3EX65_9AGAR